MPDWVSLMASSLDLLVKFLTALITLVTLGIKLKEYSGNKKEAPHRPTKKGH